MERFDSILSVLKRASILEIFLISFVLLPFVFEVWLRILRDLGIRRENIELSLGAICLLYPLFLGLMLIDRNRKRRRELARDQIVSYLQSKGFTMMTLSRVRESINAAYSDRLVESVIQQFPKHALRPIKRWKRRRSPHPARAEHRRRRLVLMDLPEKNIGNYKLACSSKLGP